MSTSIYITTTKDSPRSRTSVILINSDAIHSSISSNINCDNSNISGINGDSNSSNESNNREPNSKGDNSSDENNSNKENSAIVNNNSIITTARTTVINNINVKFIKLPLEMILQIFSFLDGDDLSSSCSVVCKTWNMCSKDESVWKSIYALNEEASLYRRTMGCSWLESGKWYLHCTKLEFDDRTRRQGRGHFTFPNGESYYGEWEASKFDGFGVCMWADGRKYQGMFKEGKRSGFGIFTWPSGCRYEGEWLEDKRHGKGKDTWPDSSSFVGEYKQDKFDGWGVFKWEDGGLYEGHWKEDHRHGFGTHKWKDGRVFQGEFSQDRFVAEIDGPFDLFNNQLLT